MNRRDFLKLLGAAGIASTTALAIVDSFELAPTKRLAKVAPALRANWLAASSIQLFAEESVPRPALFQMFRPSFSANCPLLQFSLNAFGGMLYWRAGPSEEVYILREHPVEIAADFDGVGVISGLSDIGPYVQRFLFSRGQNVKSEVYPLYLPGQLPLLLEYEDASDSTT